MQGPLGVNPFHQWELPDGTPWTAFYHTNAGYVLRFPHLADFEVAADGSKVTCAPVPEVSEATLEHLFLNQVLPLVLSARGKLVFHASAIEVPAGAIAFLGGSRRGKSTLAAYFALNGYRFLTDDGLILEPVRGGYQVIPSHPSIRLCGDSNKTLRGSEFETEATSTVNSKVRILSGTDLAYCDRPRRLRVAYFLGDGSAQDIAFRQLAPSDTMLEWVANSFVLDVGSRQMMRAHFDRVANLANMLVCYRLDFPRRYNELERLLKAIVMHATSEITG